MRELLERVLGAIVGWALRFGRVPAGAEAAELGALVLTQRATFATPVWLNVGTAARPVTAACFILSVGDSIPALLDWNASEGLIFQQGAGAGANLSRIRSSRERVSRGGYASGPVSFMRAADASAASIRAGGRARRGAKMVVLDADHPDVLEFVRAKSREERRARTLNAGGHDTQEVVRCPSSRATTPCASTTPSWSRPARAPTGRCTPSRPARSSTRCRRTSC